VICGNPFSIATVLLCAVLVRVLYCPGQAVAAEKIPRIAFVRAEKPPQDDIEAFKKGLREYGYIEGKSILVDYRWADGDDTRLRSIIAELIALNVDLIVTSAPAATQAAKDATKRIPLVMVTVADPVSFGFVTSLARPGGNITGFAYLLPEISGKRLELLKETIPSLSRVAVLWNAANAYKKADLKEVEPVAERLRVLLHKTAVGTATDFENAFKAAIKARSDGLITLEDPFTIAHRTEIVTLAQQHRLPAIYAVKPFIDAGGLMYYGPDRLDQHRRAAIYVNRILKGGKPSEMPIERPIKFELMINLTVAKQIGLTIPPQVLARADRVIK
jgi:putative tryptophan/tyrosine transport system substrate-binding protein